MTANEYLATLTDKSAWVFTKQDTSFEESFKATKLFASICYTPDINIEQAFKDIHEEFDVNTANHRMLVIPQLYGLITKTPFYSRGTQYNKERPTEVFDLIKNETIGSDLYNRIKTEQILKLKIHSIIDTANNNEDYAILPVIFMYKVLKDLQIKHGINEISIGHFWTYIATSKSYADVDDVVNYLATSDAPVSEYVAAYAGNSRILTIIRNNIGLFSVGARTISINPEFDDYFFNRFMQTHDIDVLHEQLLRDADYSYLLYNYQEFDINLIDIPSADALIVRPAPITEELDEDAVEKDYLDKVDAIKEDNVNPDIALGAYDTPPVVSKKGGKGRKYKTNPIFGKLAIAREYYTCEHNRDHVTFASNKTGKQYMEAHHLVQVADQEQIWERYGKNVDCVENLVSLCPNCHKAFHYGTKAVKSAMIDSLFEQVAHKYRAIGFTITKEEIKRLYGITE